MKLEVTTLGMGLHENCGKLKGQFLAALRGPNAAPKEKADK